MRCHEEVMGGSGGARLLRPLERVSAQRQRGLVCVRQHVVQCACTRSHLSCIASGSFFDILDQIAQPTYIPSEEDVIRVRIQTTGIFESRFEIGPMIFQYVRGRMQWLFGPLCALLMRINGYVQHGGRRGPALGASQVVVLL